MKLAIVTLKVVKGDGQGRVNYELARYLLKRGIEVHLIADEVAPELIASGAVWTRVHPEVGSIDLIRFWRFARKVDAILDQSSHCYDLIMACGVVLSRPHAVNVVHFVHGTWLRSSFHSSRVRPGINGAYQWLFSALNARWERQVFEVASRVIAVSEMVRQELIEMGVPMQKLDVILNGVDLDEYSPGDFDRSSLGLPEDAVVALFVGDIRSPVKNLDTVLRALVHVPELHLAVAGSVHGSPYPLLAAKLGVEKRVHFLGFRRDVADLMRGSDFFVLVSRRDSCPLVLLEAMASGLPVITSRQVGTADLVSQQCGYILSDPEDVTTLVESMRSLSENERLRGTMGSRSRIVAEGYGWEKMADNYLAVFESRLVTERSDDKADEELRTSVLT